MNWRVHNSRINRVYAGDTPVDALTAWAQEHPEEAGLSVFVHPADDGYGGGQTSA